MKTRLIILLFTFFIQSSFGQNTISISGKVIDESFVELPGVLIIVDGKQIATTDFDGKFQIEINKDIQKLDFRFIGIESLTVTLKENCSNLELVLLNEGGCYLGASIQKVNRIRKRRFDNRSKLHKIAYEKGIFLSQFFCGEMQFKPYK
jgi:hypothetical protein